MHTGGLYLFRIEVDFLEGLANEGVLIAFIVDHELACDGQKICFAA